MGFDVDCYKPNSTFSQEAIRAAFAEACESVRAICGTCDGFLELGSLDCSSSIDYLAQAFGQDYESMKEVFWLADEVRRRAATAVWPDPADVREEWRWSYWSARKFLEVCVRYELGIWTS